jgi:hypothetical protein
MISRSARGALVLAGLLVGACQSYEPTPVVVPTTPMDGLWLSTDGVFVANFDRGRFTSRFTSTNEILAQGSYSVAGTAVSMQWMSVATQQQRSASCSFAGADTVNCNQDGGGSFTLQRSGIDAPMAPAAAPAPAPAAPTADAPAVMPAQQGAQAPQAVEG